MRVIVTRQKSYIAFSEISKVANFCSHKKEDNSLLFKTK